MPFLFIFKKPFSNQLYQEEDKTVFSSFSRSLNSNKTPTDTTVKHDGECKRLNTSVRLVVRLEKWNEMAISEKGNEN
jgi:hypothetical protein